MRKHVFPFLTLAVLSSLSLLIGCSKEPLPVTFETVCEQKRDAWVVMQGYLRLGELTMCYDGERGTYCKIELYPAPDGAGEPIVADVYVGDEPNRMAPIPEEYDLDDLVLQTDGGAMADQDTQLKLTGQVNPNVSPCELYVRTIELP